MGTKEIERAGALAEGAGRDELRACLHGMWSGVAGGWAANAAFIDSRTVRITERMLELARPAPGERVLDLASGPGGAGLAAAPLVAPGGEVVLSDFSAQMTAIASARVAALGLSGVSVRVLDMEDIEEPDASYDVVLCRAGLMLVPDPARAAREIRRVLRPGGRVAITVWGPRASNPWLAAILVAVARETGEPVPPPGVPHPFSLDDAERLAGVLSQGGLADVAVEELEEPYRAGSPEEWWDRTGTLAGGLAQRLAALPEPVARAVRARAIEAVAPFRTPDGIEMPGLHLVASARAPLA